jgi:hypothetical protein
MKINLVQRIIFAMVMVQLAAILVLQYVLVNNDAAFGIVKYAIITTIFVASLLLPKPSRVHWALWLAILLLFVGDFFLVFLWLVLLGVAGDSLVIKVGGMAGFLSAYVCLTWVYTRKFSFGARDLLSALPVLAVLVPILILLVPHVTGPFLIVALVFAFTVGFMAWNAICTIHRGYYRRSVSIKFAVAGYLMFLSDMGVALTFFYPGLQGNIPWLLNEVWVTYVPGWTLILITIAENTLIEDQIKV